MAKQLLGIFFLSALWLGPIGCEKKETDADLKHQKEVQWREHQRAQAIKYYGDLVKNYPDSPHATEAKQRLDALKPPATPAGK